LFQLEKVSVDHPELEETYLTVAEVAETLKLNQQTVRNWIDQGSLPALRVGRRVRIKRSDFERVLADGYRAGTGMPQNTGPSAQDFWGGEPVGLAEPAPAPDNATAADHILRPKPATPSNDG
jgi:excisionase family DNA binding protein